MQQFLNCHFVFKSTQKMGLKEHTNLCCYLVQFLLCAANENNVHASLCQLQCVCLADAIS